MGQDSLSGLYDKDFYAAQMEGSARSASVLASLIAHLFPSGRTVVDIGCGTGVWLHYFKRAGFDRVLGIDGSDPSNGLLQISQGEFMRADLSRPIESEERFDLCLCLEVAEHVREASAGVLVASLCRLSDVVVFGAAIPGQGGTRHLNERWASYWTALFEREGYGCFDVLRPRIWNDERVEWWYRQNTLIFARKAREDLTDRLVAAETEAGRPVDVVHPRCFMAYREYAEEVAVLRMEVSLLRGAQADVERLGRERDNAQEVAVRLRSDIDRLGRDRDSSEGAAAELRRELSKVAAEKDGAVVQAQQLWRELEEIRNSTSWRLTGPVRRALSTHPRARRTLRRTIRFAVWAVTLGLVDFRDGLIPGSTG